MAEKQIIGVCLGDAAGVGPEIVAKLAARNYFDEYCRPVLVGDVRVFERAESVTGTHTDLQVIDKIEDADWSKGTPFLNRNNLDPATTPFATKTVESGAACLDMLKTCVELFNEGKMAGFCFGPLNKAGMKDAGLHLESEHWYMAELLNHTAPFGEINVVGKVWTTRTTSHIPIKEVSDALYYNNGEKIDRAITLMYATLTNAGMENPHIAVAALNPHAGENGTCGREEIDVITPAIERANAKGWNCSGPYPSDTLFMKAFRGDFDGVVTMFHDQGQIALKVVGFDEGITIAGGFEVPCATCGHGTAYDIAGKNIVKTSSFEVAVRMTASMADARAAKAEK